MPQSDNEKARDKAIRHALLLLAFGRGLGARIVAILNRGDAAILARIAAGVADIEERGLVLSATASKAVETMLSDVADLNASAYAAVAAALKDELGAFATTESAFQAQALDSSLGVTDTATALASDDLAALVTDTPIDGAPIAAWTDSMEAGRLARIAQAVRTGISRGSTTDAIVAAIKGTKALGYTDGVLNVSRNSAQAASRTAATGIANAVAQITWQNNDVGKWQFLAVLDERTSLTCASLDGSIWPVNEGPMPPLHMNCRSVPTPVLPGKPAGSITLLDWLNGKEPAQQNSILGKTRGDLFRTGKLSIKDMVKGDGTVLTLAQLAEAHTGILD